MEKDKGPEPKTCTLTLMAQNENGQPEMLAVAEINLGLHFGNDYQTSWIKMKPEAKNFIQGDIDIVYSATLSCSTVAKDVEEFNKYSYWRRQQGNPPMLPDKFPTAQKVAPPARPS